MALTLLPRLVMAQDGRVVEESGAVWLDAEHLDALRSIGAHRHLPAGVMLFLEGDDPHDVLLVESGELKVVSGGADGAEVVLEVLGEGEVLGELSAIDGGPRSATAVTLTDCELIAIGRQQFNEYLDENPAAMRALLTHTIGRLRTANARQVEIRSGDALTRVCARILDLAERYGVVDGDGVHIASPLNQSELAQWCGLSREAVVKALRTLRKLGWIDNQGADIDIHDVDEVRRRAELS